MLVTAAHPDPIDWPFLSAQAVLTIVACTSEAYRHLQYTYSLCIIAAHFTSRKLQRNSLTLPSAQTAVHKCMVGLETLGPNGWAFMASKELKTALHLFEHPSVMYTLSRSLCYMAQWHLARPILHKSCILKLSYRSYS